MLANFIKSLFFFKRFVSKKVANFARRDIKIVMVLCNTKKARKARFGT